MQAAACTAVFLLRETQPTFDVGCARTSGICFDSALGRSSVRALAFSSLPACRHVLPCPCRQSPTLFPPTRCPSSDECGNPRPHACGGCDFRLPIRSAAAAPARFHASHCGARLPFPSRRGSCALRLRSPRHAAPARAPSGRLCCLAAQ